MSGECDVCGEMGCVEYNHCAFLKTHQEELTTKDAEITRLQTIIDGWTHSEGREDEQAKEIKRLREALEEIGVTADNVGDAVRAALARKGGGQ